MSNFEIFTGNPRERHSETAKLTQPPPPWRDFRSNSRHRGQTYLPSPEEVRIVNAALRLRRPVLVTGAPGCGKSSLAYAIAEELELGPVLKWPINSRSTLAEGLYHYDAIARLRDANLANHNSDAKQDVGDISRYLRLQWLGTALTSRSPRVLLLDEIDKADIDLPNDLLHVLEEGTFNIPELQRLSTNEQSNFAVRTCEPGGQTVNVKDGTAAVGEFPIIILTSNGERELPLAFHRRCLRINIQEPDEERLTEIVNSHLRELLRDKKTGKNKRAESKEATADSSPTMQSLVKEFIDARQKGGVVATDQLLNYIYLVLCGESLPPKEEREALREMLFRRLDQ